MSTIKAATSIDELLDLLPEANGYLIERGLPCLVCGEPFWGSLGDLASKHGVEDIDSIVAELNAMLDAKGGPE
jgi:hypothetical protein